MLEKISLSLSLSRSLGRQQAKISLTRSLAHSFHGKSAQLRFSLLQSPASSPTPTAPHSRRSSYSQHHLQQNITPPAPTPLPTTQTTRPYHVSIARLATAVAQRRVRHRTRRPKVKRDLSGDPSRPPPRWARLPESPPLRKEDSLWLALSLGKKSGSPPRWSRSDGRWSGAHGRWSSLLPSTSMRG